jgi:hypothetical protein
MDPIRVFPIIALISLPTVMFGGYALHRFITRGEGLSEFKLTFFRAGHAHAGVLLVLALVYFEYLARTRFTNTTRWLVGATMVTGILAQSGGFFLHMGLGEPGRSSMGTTMTRVGGLLLAAAMLLLAYGLIVA